MKMEVSKGIEDLKKQFNASEIVIREDEQGGAYIIVENVSLGSKYIPAATWLGFQIPAQYPYADIYPMFIGADVKRSDGQPFVAPVTHGHNFEGRAAIQVSRRNTTAQNGQQRVSAKALKVLDFIDKLC